MGERVRFERLEGHPLLISDVSGLGAAEARAVLEEAHRRSMQLPPNGSLLSLIVVKGMRFDPPLVDRMKEMGKAGAPWVRATALAGVSALGRLVVRVTAPFSGRTLGAFDDEPEARRWLLEQAAKAKPG